MQTLYSSRLLRLTLRNVEEAEALTVRICPKSKTRQAMYILLTLRRFGKTIVAGEKRLLLHILSAKL